MFKDADRSHAQARVRPPRGVRAFDLDEVTAALAREGFVDGSADRGPVRARRRDATGLRGEDGFAPLTFGRDRGVLR